MSKTPIFEIELELQSVYFLKLPAEDYDDAMQKGADWANDPDNYAKLLKHASDNGGTVVVIDADEIDED